MAPKLGHHTKLEYKGASNKYDWIKNLFLPDSTEGKLQVNLFLYFPKSVPSNGTKPTDNLLSP